MSSTAPRHPLRAALGGALEIALNRLLALDPDSVSAVQSLEGRELGLALQAPPLALRVRVEQGKLRVGPEHEGAAPDLSIGTTLGVVLARLLPGREPDAMPIGQVRISGDAELARRLQQLVERYQPDVEELFARSFGDVVGVQLARALKRGLDWARDSAGALARDSAEFLTEESRDLVSKPELEQFLDEVDTLRDGVERFERRLQRLQARG
jgi:ubiquinone biosynthesis protein UbiJ